MPGEVEVLVLRQTLIGKNQHRILRERIFDRDNIGRLDRPRQIDVADLGGEVLRDRTDGDAHERRLQTNFLAAF